MAILATMSRARSREVHGSSRAESKDAGLWRVRLPRGAGPPFRVWINGVEQQAGDDYTVGDDALVFDKPLAKEGRLGLFRWALIFFGIAGTYRKNDSVDVQFTTSTGNTRLVTGLDIEPPAAD
jgi:hypothetical protein